MQKQPLIELIHDLEQEMLRLGYTKNSMTIYRRRWKMLLQFAQERGEVFYSERLGIDFVEKKFHIFEKDCNHTLSRSKTQELRIIRLIFNFQLYHTVSHCKHREILTEPHFFAIRNKFELYCVNKGYSKKTIDLRLKESARFMNYIALQNVTDCKVINLELIHAYINKTLTGYSYKTVANNIGSLRAFFRFLLETEEIQTDFSAKIITVEARNQIRIPSVWTEDEIKKLIAAIDRGSPNGKRDYAIILLAYCLGIRCADIRHLKMENFLWEEEKLVFIQSKTKNSLSLPLTQEVGWAVIDYLKYGRPKTDTSYVFIRHHAPFAPFVESNGLHYIIKKYMGLAHLPILNKKRGIHSLRHTMASTLLEKDTQLSTISDILGHADTKATAIYLKVGMKKLKECSLSFEEVNDHE